MNYLTHGYRFVANKYFLAGTAVPDWLSVVNRRVRVRSKHAAKFAAHSDPHVAAVAQGIVQHHRDDHWFHNTRAFAELSLQFTVSIRDLLPPDKGFRPSFLGHILVELLLDAVLIEDDPALLDSYYAALKKVNPTIVAGAICQMTGNDLPLLNLLIPTFVSERFLADYLDDANLLVRLNHVMKRVQLPRIQEALRGFFPEARDSVRQRKAELLAGESENELA